MVIYLMFDGWVELNQAGTDVSDWKDSFLIHLSDSTVKNLTQEFVRLMFPYKLPIWFRNRPLL
jgi:hypothetical protein